MEEDGLHRISIVLKSKKQHVEWLEFMNQNGYSNLSQMIRVLVEKARSENINLVQKELQPIKDSIQGLCKMNEYSHQQLEIITMKLNKDVNSNVTNAAKEILSILKSARTPAEIRGKSSYQDDIVKSALSLIHDLGIFEISCITTNKVRKEEHKNGNV